MPSPWPKACSTRSPCRLVMKVPPWKSSGADRSTESVSKEPSSRCSGSMTEPPSEYTWYSKLRTFTSRPSRRPHSSLSRARTASRTRRSRPGRPQSSDCSAAMPWRYTTRCSWRLCRAASAEAWKPAASSGKSKSEGQASPSPFEASASPAASSPRCAFPRELTRRMSSAERSPTNSAGAVASASVLVSCRGGPPSACQSNGLVPKGGTTKTPQRRKSWETLHPSSLASAKHAPGSA
mmetsp:Transcript_15279/g.33913  ORF Transcript_15279/g.33913 Transcript_15279/m.33913 type:complete len:237 (-) Transcript_15279:68-778(-)